MSLATDYEPEPQADELAHALAWALVAAFGIWAGWGWVADGINALSLLLAVVFGLFQIATNILAVKVRELWGRGAWLTAFAAATAMVVTGLFTHESLNHAYMVTQAQGYANADPQLMSWLLLVVPYLEPLMFWINRLLLEPKRSSGSRPVAIGLFPLLAAYLFGPGTAVASEPPRPPAMPPTPPTPAVKRLTQVEARYDDPMRAQARLLAQQGQRPAEIHRATGVPLSTCKRWAKAA